jgi:peptide/nickel transport system substrate-binding protein
VVIILFCSPVSTYPEQFQYSTPNWINAALISDSYIEEMAEKARVEAITDFKTAMATTRELRGYILGNAYAIQAPRYPLYCLWWPWLKNYNGETSVGYFPGDSWVQWVWIDQTMKKSLGY